MGNKVTKPWGTYEVLKTDDIFQTKEIVIFPDQAPSYQMHYKRKEIWMVTQGNGILRQNDILKDVNVGDVIYIDYKDKHQLKNTGKENLIFIEIQIGSYFGEDDIVRLEDLYGRTKT